MPDTTAELRHTRPERRDDALPATTVVLDGVCALYPNGTRYGGGPATHRDRGAEPVDRTPPHTQQEFLAKLGSVGTALDWAIEHELATLGAPGRRRADDSSGEPLDVMTWTAEFDLAQWSEFASRYEIELDEHGRPDCAERIDDSPAWLHHDAWYAFNVGGISLVDHAEVEIRFHTT